MTLESIYYIGQTMAVIAIIASLIFVGIQVRQSAAAMRAAAFQTSQDRMDRIRLAIIENEGVAEIYQLANTNPLRLTDRQIAQFRLLLYVTFTSFESLHVDFVQTGSARHYWDINRAMMRRVISAPGSRAFWALYRQEFNPKFARDMDEILSESDTYRVITPADWAKAFKTMTPSGDIKP